MERIRNTNLYRSLTEGRTDVEIWEDNFTEGGWQFFSIVAFKKGEATILAQLRLNEEQIEHRVRDDSGNDTWLEAT